MQAIHPQPTAIFEITTTDGLYEAKQPRSAPLEGIRGVIALAHPSLPLLLGDDVLDPDLLRPLLLEVADVSRVPQLGRDAQVLAAAHQGVGLAALPGGGDAVVGEELALAAGLCYESVVARLECQSVCVPIEGVTSL